MPNAAARILLLSTEIETPKALSRLALAAV